MITRVTPNSVSRSTITSSERVIVEYVTTSCARRPDPPRSGTRAQHTSSALPMSNPATRATISS